MTKIYLIRHAEAEGNLYRRVHGQYDSLVTVLGMRQIEALAERFKEVELHALYSSDRIRTKTTAGAVTKYHDLPIIETPGLREVNLGVWEDNTWGNLAKTDYVEQRNFIFNPEECNPPGSESFNEYQSRMYETVEKIAKNHDGQTVAAVTHGMVLRALVAKIQNVPSNEISKLGHGDNTSVSLLYYDNGEFKIEYLNDTSHLNNKTSTFARQAWWKDKDGKDKANMWFAPLDMNKEADLYKYCYRQAWIAAHGSDRGFEPGLYVKLARRHAKMDPRFVMKVMYDDELAGVVELDPERGMHEGLGWISLCVLLPEFRHRGLGVQLIGHGVSVMRSLGRSRIGLSVSEDNINALGFYERFGFRRVGTSEGALGNLIIMEMNI